MNCRKCQEEGTIIIKKDYVYCESCYLVYINHKFRACIGKNKIISPNEKVLIALSGGLGSTALLDLIHTGVTLNTHKKLRIDPQFVHLTGVDRDSNAEVIMDQCRHYGFNILVYDIISKCTPNDNILLSDWTATHKTMNNDCKSRIVQNVLVNIAKELKCRLIFTAEHATSLASKMLSGIVIGRGAQLENDIGFVDNRHENIKILRPLCDITKEELDYYAKMKLLTPSSIHNEHNNLQSVIDNFVATLETESPATISTICKTADKIGSDHYSDRKNICTFCKGKLDKDTKKLTAIQAIIFSRMVSNRSKQYGVQLEDMENANEEISDQSIVPFIHHQLCYCCSRNYAQIDDPNLRKLILGLQK